MRVKTGTILGLVLTGITFSGCYYDTEEELYSSVSCDTASVTYSGTVKPMIEQQCLSCHSGAQPSGGIDLSTYAAVKVQADNGQLYGAIAHLEGFQPMPQGSKLSNCDISKVKIWVDASAPQN
jgi:hypothetical protein